MRLKFPMLDDADLNNVKAGFRVEFRPMDLQPTSSENVAFITFLRLVSLALLHYRLDLRIPVSMLYENVMYAVEIDACRRARFHWRVNSAESEAPHQNSTTRTLPTCEQNHNDAGSVSSDVKILPLTVQQIFTGVSNSEGGFVGLLPLVRNYLKLHSTTLQTKTRAHIEKCLQFVEDVAMGEWEY